MTGGKGWPLVVLLAGLALAAALFAGALLTSPLLNPEAEALWAPLAADKSLGVNVDLARLAPAERQDALAAMKAAGLVWLRQRFAWDEIEPQRGVYDWDRWDELVETVSRHNIKLVAVLDGAPAWARAPEDGAEPLAPPVETRDFGDWAAAVAARYGDRIDTYQVWDEPNIAPHWGAREIDPAAYARLLREGAIRVRAADPGATILLAALAPNVEPGGANMSEVQFLDALYGLGAAEWFDAVALQPYGFDQPLDAVADGQALNWRRVELAREVMAARGDGSTAVWATAFGWPGQDGEAVAAAVGLARREWPWLGPMLWSAWSASDAHGEYALVDSSGAPGAVYAALADAAPESPLAWPGAYPAGHASGQYQGQWRVTPLLADVGQSGDTLTLPFRGTGLDLAVRRGPYRAFLYVTVDGQPANALPRDVEGRSYVVLYDPLAAQDQVALARRLAPGDHVAEIVAEGGWGQWAIAGWVVRWDEAGGRAPWLPWALAVAGVVVLAVSAAVTWSHRRAVPGAVRAVLPAVRAAVEAYRSLDPRLALAITGAAALLTYLMDGTLPALAAVGLLALLLLLRPETGLPLIAFSLPFSQLGRPLLGKVFSMTEILVVLTAAAWLASRWAGGWMPEASRTVGRPGRAAQAAPRLALWRAFDWGVLALVVVAVVSLLWAEQGREAARELRMVVLEGALFYALVRVMVREQRAVWRLADAWVAGAAVIALVGLGQWLLGRNVIAADGVWRVRGFYGSPNNLALYLGRVLPLAVVVGLPAAGLRAAGLRAAGGRRWAYAGAALAIAAALFFTYSRGAWVVGVPLSLLFLAAMRGRRTFVLVLVGLVVVALLFVGLAGPARLTSLLDTEQGTTFFRIQLWQSSWAMVRDHPLLGVGLDNFLYQYRTHYVLPTAWEEFDLSHPHNLVLDFWLRLGLPGLLVAGWLLACFFRGAGRLYRGLAPGDDRRLVLGLMGGMVYFVAHGLVDNAFFLPDLAFSFLLMAALALACGENTQPVSPIPNQERSSCAS